MAQTTKKSQKSILIKNVNEYIDWKVCEYHFQPTELQSIIIIILFY